MFSNIVSQEVGPDSAIADEGFNTEMVVELLNDFQGVCHNIVGIHLVAVLLSDEPCLYRERVRSTTTKWHRKLLSQLE